MVDWKSCLLTGYIFMYCVVGLFSWTFGMSFPVESFFFFFFLGGGGLSTSLIPCGKFWSSYPVKATAAARAALSIPNSACGIFVCQNKGMAASALDL